MFFYGNILPMVPKPTLDRTFAINDLYHLTGSGSRTEQAFHRSWKTRQAMLGMSPTEVLSVLAEKTYAGVMSRIEEIKRSKSN